MRRVVYNRKLRSLVGKNGRHTPYESKSIYKGLVRVDEDKDKENMMKSKSVTDLKLLPFKLPRNKNNGKVYLIYKGYYCTFAHPTTCGDDVLPEFKVNKPHTSVVQDFTEWSITTKTEYEGGITEDVRSKLDQQQLEIEHPESLAGLNYFFLFNKFIKEGHVIWSSSEDQIHMGCYPQHSSHHKEPNLFPDNCRKYLTTLYGCTVLDERRGLVIDPNLFTLLESIKDDTTDVYISETVSPELKKIIGGAQYGVDTNLTKDLPTDRTLFAAVTCILRPCFSVKTHVADTE